MNDPQHGWWLKVDPATNEAWLGRGEVVWARCADIAYGRAIYHVLERGDPPPRSGSGRPVAPPPFNPDRDLIGYIEEGQK